MYENNNNNNNKHTNTTYIFIFSRWIRLLFGREFPLPNVLEVWDALFADGPSLVDYMCVSMLMHIREVCKSFHFQNDNSSTHVHTHTHTIHTRIC